MKCDLSNMKKITALKKQSYLALLEIKFTRMIENKSKIMRFNLINDINQIQNSSIHDTDDDIPNNLHTFSNTKIRKNYSSFFDKLTKEDIDSCENKDSNKSIKKIKRYLDLPAFKRDRGSFFQMDE